MNGGRVLNRFGLDRLISNVRRPLPWGYLLAFVLAVILLSPMLHGGYMADDSLNSARFAKATLELRGTNIFSAAVQEQLGWIVAQGRVFPVAAYTYFLFYLTSGNLWLFKVITFMLVLLDVVLMAYVVRRLSRSHALAMLAVLLLPLALQFRASSYFDPTLEFGGMMPVLLGLILGATALLLDYVETGRRSMLVGSLLLYGLGLLEYEIAMAVFPIFFLIVWLYPRRHPVVKSIRLSWPYAALAFATAALALSLRLAFGRAVFGDLHQYAQTVSAGGDPASGAYGISLAPGPVLLTFAKQVAAAFPMSFQVFDKLTRPYIPTLGHDLTNLGVAGGASIAVLAVALACIAAQTRVEVAEESATKLAPLAAFAGCLLCLSQVLISLSPRYQSEVSWGIAYLPVYFGYFAVAMLLAVAVYGCFRAAARSGFPWLALALAIAFFGLGVIAVMNYANNRVVIEIENSQMRYSREVLEDAAARGALDGLPADATILIDSSSAWDSPELFESLTGKSVSRVLFFRNLPASFHPQSTSVVKPDGTTIATFPESDKLYWVSRAGFWPGNGRVLFGRLSALEIKKGQVKGVELRSSALYLGSDPRPNWSEDLPNHPMAGLANTLPASSGFATFAPALVRIAAGPDWATYSTADGTIRFGQ